MRVGLTTQMFFSLMKQKEEQTDPKENITKDPHVAGLGLGLA